MYSQVLTAIYIKGFKTFARPVRMPLEGGITAIVGPNGSGKSNVTDAVLFALGEQSPGILRAGAMGDLIFSGSESLPAASAAEVSLVFDNGSGEISLPYSEVSVTRRISRAGETEYRINGSRSRLADVRAVAGEAGLGRHSILRQGAVDAILAGGGAACRQAPEGAASLGEAERRAEALEDATEDLRAENLRADRALLRLEAGLGRRGERRAVLAHLREELERTTRKLAGLEERSERLAAERDRASRDAREKEKTAELARRRSFESGRERSRLAAELDRLRTRASVLSDGAQNGVLSEKDLASLGPVVQEIEAGGEHRPGGQARRLDDEASGALRRAEACFEGINRRRGELAAATGRAESRVRRLRGAGPASTGTRLYEVVRPPPGFEAAGEG